jgi:hypothetical protein
MFLSAPFKHNFGQSCAHFMQKWRFSGKRAGRAFRDNAVAAFTKNQTTSVSCYGISAAIPLPSGLWQVKTDQVA